MKADPVPGPEAPPLCVDLDGTVIHSDLLLESFLLLIRRSPARLLEAPVRLLRGRAGFKRWVAERVDLDPAALPYNERFVEYLRGEKAAGRRLVLATASDELLARRVAAHLDLFSEVIASDGSDNLKGEGKLKALQARFPRFDYAGDSAADLVIFRHARESIIVDPQAGLLADARRVARVGRVFEPEPGRWRHAVRALRPHQWAKNLLIWVPLLTSHRILEPATALKGVLAFVVFCLFASAAYVLNDVLDLADDRLHPTKKRRPFASGALPLRWAPALIAGLAAAGLLAASPLPTAFLGAVALYFATTVAYSLWLKSLALVDVFVLAGLYTLRLLAGHAATGVVLSAWLTGFAIFIFLSLALLKRCAELRESALDGRSPSRGRGYVARDLEFLTMFGTVNGVVSSLIFALYINSDHVRTLYRQPAVLWAICPLILFWIGRVWFIVQRGGMDGDPVLFALKDRTSYAVGAAIALLMAAAH